MNTETEAYQLPDYASWIHRWPWHHFATFTFGRVLSPSTCEHHWKTFINSLERYTRGRIGWLRVPEGRWSGCGKPYISLHYHALLIYKHPPAPGVVEAMWGAKSGDAQVEVYDPGRGAAWYITKMFPKNDCDFDLGGLEYFPVPGDQSQDSDSEKPVIVM